MPAGWHEFGALVQGWFSVHGDNAQLLCKAKLATLRSVGVGGGLLANRPPDMVPSLFKFQMYFKSSVLLLYLSCRMLKRWLLYRSLKVLQLNRCNITHLSNSGFLCLYFPSDDRIAWNLQKVTKLMKVTDWRFRSSQLFYVVKVRTVLQSVNDLSGGINVT